MKFTNNPYKYIDTHCHLDLYQDYGKVITLAEKKNIYIVAITNLPSIYQKEKKIINSNNVALSLGYHPQLIKEYENQIELFIEQLPTTKFVGEVGLDYKDSNYATKEKQKQIFNKILESTARYKDKIISIHNRQSSADVVDMIGPNFPGSIILHWYSGSSSTLRKAINYGYYFSVNPKMTISKSGQEIINILPIERILTETDGPFVKIENKTIDQEDLMIVVNYLEKLHNKNELEIRNILNNNFLNILNN